MNNPRHLQPFSKRQRPPLLAAFLLWATLAAGALAADETNRPSVFVAPLSGDRGIAYWQPAVGDGLAEMLITELTKLGKFDMLESTTLDSIKDEIKMGDDGWIEPGEKVEKGHWGGADYMFVGKVVRFGAKSKSFGGGGPFSIAGVKISKSESEIEIVWRFVDAATRKIVSSGKAVGVEKGTSWGFGGALGSGFVRDREFRDSALGKATIKAMDAIVSDVSKLNIGPGTRAKLRDQKIAEKEQAAQAELAKLRSTPGAVEAVADGFLIISLGTKHGLKSGEKLNLYEINEVKNKEGKVVFKDEKLVGEVVADSVQEERCKGRYSGTAQVKEGWVVKIPPAQAAK